MKLLRLTSRSIDGTFSSDFNADISLEPDSKIALQSISIDSDPLRIDVSAQNNDLTIEWSNTTTRNISLKPYSYNSANFGDLLQDISNKCNDSCNFVVGETNKTIGIEWNADRDAGNKVNIKYKNGAVGEYTSEWHQEGTVARSPTGSVGNAGYWANIGADTLHTINHISLDKFISRGNGNVSCRIAELTDTSDGYIIGLTSNEQAIINNSFNINDVTYGIRVYGDAGTRKYATIRDGTETVSVVTVGYVGDNLKDNDFQEVQIDGNKVRLNTYKLATGNVAQELINYDYVTNEKLFPILIFMGAEANCKVNGLNTTPSPFNPSLADLVADKYLPDFDDALGKPPRQTRNLTQNRLIFASDELALFLGYNNRVNPPTQPLVAQEPNFIADRVFNVPEHADSYIIQLMNLQTESYDSFSSSVFASGGQRQNLLAIIPATSTTGDYVYYPPYPTFLDLANKETTILRNIKLRVLYTDYTPVTTQGLGSIVIILKSNSDK